MIKGLHYEETYAPVVQWATIRFFISLVWRWIVESLRVYGGGNITFFDPPTKLLIHYYISTMIHLHYGGES